MTDNNIHLMQTHGPISQMLIWSSNHFGYSITILVKDTIPTLAAVVIGFILGLFAFSYLLKGVCVFHDKDAGVSSVAKLRRNKNTQVIITTSQSCLFREKPLTKITLLMSAMIIKFSPLKRIQIMDKRSTRNTIATLIVIILAICVFAIVVDFHSVFPNGHGGYTVLGFK